MSPRSVEFMDQARDRAVIARVLLAAGHPEGAVSAAYYAMLYAARAALSEGDEYARTHGGTWHLFFERYVTTGAFVAGTGANGYVIVQATDADGAETFAEVTVGGVATVALSSKTMEAREVRGLFVIGEAVDVTGWLGGYNFQWAWSSGFVAGQAV